MNPTSKLALDDRLTPLQRSALRIISEELVGPTADLFVDLILEIVGQSTSPVAEQCQLVDAPSAEPSEPSTAEAENPWRDLPKRNEVAKGIEVEWPGPPIATFNRDLPMPSAADAEQSATQPIGGPLSTLDPRPVLTIGELQEFVANDPELKEALDSLDISDLERNGNEQPHGEMAATTGSIPIDANAKLLPIPDRYQRHRSVTYTVAQLIAIFHDTLAGIVPSKIAHNRRLTPSAIYNAQKTLEPYLKAAKSLSGKARNDYVDEVCQAFRAKPNATSGVPANAPTAPQRPLPELKVEFPKSILKQVALLLHKEPSLPPGRCLAELMKTDAADFVWGKGELFTDHWTSITQQALSLWPREDAG